MSRTRVARALTAMWLSDRGWMYEAWTRQGHKCLQCASPIDARELDERRMLLCVRESIYVVVCAACVSAPAPAPSAEANSGSDS